MVEMKGIISVAYKNAEKILAESGVGRYRIVSRLSKYLRNYLKSDFINIDGHKIFIDPNDSLRLSINKTYEEFPLEIAKQEIKQGDVVLDLGANIGYHTLKFARLVGKKGKVFAFEPEPYNFALLKKNLEINGYNNVVLVQKAVSAENTKIKLYLSEENTADNRIFDSKDDRKFIEIESVTLDKYFENYEGKINFIKMNIQGSESGAIQGMSSLIEKNKDLKIIFEFTPCLHVKYGTSPEELLKLLTDRGFSLYHLDRKKKKILPVNLTKLLEKYTPEKENAAHLLSKRVNMT